MTVVNLLEQAEPVCVDIACVEMLYRRLGPIAAENLMSRAVEDLAVLLSGAEAQLAAGEFEGLDAAMRDIVAIADQIGLAGLSLVAGHVSDSIATRNGAALAATMARLGRIGARALTAIWDARDQSG